MRAGRLDKRIYIETPTEVVDADTGQRTQTWEPWAYVWAGIEPVGQAERWQGQQQRTKATHVVHLRFGDGLTVKHRIRYLPTPSSTARVFRIVGVVNVQERRRELLVDVEEVA